jgi:hypothetical protein
MKRISHSKKKLTVTSLDVPIAALARRTDHKTLAIWAADCVERVLPLFETRCPADDRPRRAISALRTWVQTGVFNMTSVRQIALSAHAAARQAEKDHAACAAARAAGQAMATAHVPGHAVAAAVYAATAVSNAAGVAEGESTAELERRWQYQHLQELTKSALSRPQF